MKKISKLLLTTAMFALTFGLTACKDADDGGTDGLNVSFHVDEVLNAQAGEYFSVPIPTCTDENGKQYFPSFEVKDPSGQAVILDGEQFFAGVTGDYTLIYTVTVGDETQTKTVTIRSADTAAPTISLAKTELWGVQEQEIEFPKCTVYDAFSEKEEITVNAAVYYGEEEILCSQTSFVAEYMGEYKIVYTATDKAGNVATAEAKVNCVKREADHVTYFDKAFGSEGISLLPAGTAATTQTKKFADEEYSLKASFAGAYDAVLIMKLDTPFMKDISDFDEMSFSVYSEIDTTKGFQPNFYIHNGTDATTPVPLKVNDWTDIRFYKSGTQWFLEGGEYGIAVNEGNIAGLMLCCQYGASQKDNPASAYYFSAIRVSKSSVTSTVVANVAETVRPSASLSLPAATVGGSATGVTQKVYVDGVLTTQTSVTLAEGEHKIVYAVYKDGQFVTYLKKTVRAEYPQATVEMPAKIPSDVAFTLPVATYDGSTEGVTQEVYIDGSATAHGGATVTFSKAQAGEHVFLFKVRHDGQSVGELTKTVTVYPYEEGNATYFDKAFGIDSVVCGLEPTLNPVSITSEKAHGEETSSLKFTTSQGAGNYWGYGQLNLIDPYIKDLSGYVSTLTSGSGNEWDDFVAIDFYVFAEVDAASDFTPCINYGRGSQATNMLALKKNAWTKVRFYSYNGTSWGLIVEDAEQNATMVTMDPTDISDWFIRFYYGVGKSDQNPTANYYLSTLRVLKG